MLVKDRYLEIQAVRELGGARGATLIASPVLNAVIIATYGP
jgi:hypothetical protein